MPVRPLQYGDLADGSSLISEVVTRIAVLGAASACIWLWLTGPAGPFNAFTARTYTIGLAIMLLTACAWMPDRMDERVGRLKAGRLIRGFGFVGLAVLAGVMYAVFGS